MADFPSRKLAGLLRKKRHCMLLLAQVQVCSRSSRPIMFHGEEGERYANPQLGIECPQSHLQQFPSNGRLSRDATPVPARKRQLDETSKSDLLPSKRTKLTRDVPEPGAEDTKAEQADKVRHCSLTQLNH